LASSYSLRENFLEEAFILQKHLGMSYSEVKNLPLSYRKWFIERLVRHFKSVNKKNKPVSTKQSNTVGKPDSDQSTNIKNVERFFKKFSK